MGKAAAKGSSGKTLEQAVGYAFGHQVRVEILAALHEGPMSPSDLVKFLRRPMSTITHHLDGLLEAGSIDIAAEKQVGNITQYFYKACELPEYNSEEFMEMTPEE